MIFEIIELYENNRDFLLTYWGLTAKWDSQKEGSFLTGTSS